MAPHSILNCSNVSSPMPHNRHSGASSLTTRTIHRVSAGWWPVRKRVRSTLSLLASDSSYSSLILLRYTWHRRGWLTCSQGSLLSRACCVTLSSGTSRCSMLLPASANLSASTLPITSQYPGPRWRWPPNLSYAFATAPPIWGMCWGPLPVSPGPQSELCFPWSPMHVSILLSPPATSPRSQCCSVCSVTAA